MTDKHAPILDFDPAIAAIIEPQELHPAIEGLPHRCVITWMGDAFSQFENSHDVTERHRFTLETVVNPIYELMSKARRSWSPWRTLERQLLRPCSKL